MIKLLDKVFVSFGGGVKIERWAGAIGSRLPMRQITMI